MRIVRRRRARGSRQCLDACGVRALECHAQPRPTRIHDSFARVSAERMLRPGTLLALTVMRMLSSREICCVLEIATLVRIRRGFSAMASVRHCHARSGSCRIDRTSLAAMPWTRSLSFYKREGGSAKSTAPWVGPAFIALLEMLVDVLGAISFPSRPRNYGDVEHCCLPGPVSGTTGRIKRVAR